MASNFMLMRVFSRTRSSRSVLSVLLLLFKPIKTEKPSDSTLIMIAVDISIVKSYTAFHFLWHTSHHRSMCAACYVFPTSAKRNAQSSNQIESHTVIMLLQTEILPQTSFPCLSSYGSLRFLNSLPYRLLLPVNGRTRLN